MLVWTEVAPDIAEITDGRLPTLHLVVADEPHVVRFIRDGARCSSARQQEHGRKAKIS